MDLLPGGLFNGRIVFLRRFVVGGDFFVELREDALVLRVPGCLCRISVLGRGVFMDVTPSSLKMGSS